MLMDLGLDLGGVAGSVLGGVFGMIGNKQQYNAQTQLMQNQYEYNTWLQQQQALLTQGINQQEADLDFTNWKKQFDMSNEYNSPVNQLKRLYDAGINPLFSGMQNTSSMAASGTYSGGLGGSSSVGLPSAPDFGRTGLAVGDGLQNAVSLDLQKQHMKNETKQTDANVAESNARTENIKVDTQLKPDMSYAQIKYWGALAYDAYKSGDLKIVESDQAKANIDLIKTKTREISQNMIMQIRDFNLRVSEFAWKKYTDEEHLKNQMYGLVTDRMNANTNYINAQTGRMQYELDKDRFWWTQVNDNRNYRLAVKHYELEFMNSKFDHIGKMLDKASISPFGVSLGFNRDMLLDIGTMVQGYTNALDKADYDKTMEIFGNCHDGIESLIQTAAEFAIFRGVGGGIMKAVGSMGKYVPAAFKKFVPKFTQQAKAFWNTYSGRRAKVMEEKEFWERVKYARKYHPGERNYPY